MAHGTLQNVLIFARRMAEASGSSQASDSDLLEHFTLHNDQGSFAVLIERHGALVWGACCRVLERVQDAEDCFQATFLVLARKASSLRRGDSLAGWLHRVAYRLALRSQAGAGRRQKKEGRAAAMKPVSSQPEESWNELRGLLDRELEHLPPVCRAPLVLCYLEGKSNVEAARELGCPLGTIKGRLARGRDLLRKGLQRRGLTLGATALVAMLSEQAASAAVPGILVLSTGNAAAAFASGKTAAASAGALSLAEGFLRAATLGTLLKSALVMIGLALTTGGGVLLAGPALVDDGNKNLAKNASEGNIAARVEIPKKVSLRLDAFGDPLPEFALSRLGSSRYRPGFETRSLVLTPDGKEIISEGADGIRFWDFATGKQIRALEWQAAPGADYGRSFSPDRDRFVSPGDEKRLWIYDSRLGTKLASFGQEQFSQAGYSPDGKYIAGVTMNKPRTVELFEVHSGKRIWQSGPYAYDGGPLQFTADGKAIVMACWNLVQSPTLPGNSILVLETASGREKRKIDLGEAHPMEVAVSPDGNQVAANIFTRTNDSPNETWVWDLVTGKRTHRIKSLATDARTGAQHFLYRLSFLTEGKALVAAIANSDELIVWDLTTDREMRRLGRGMQNVSSITVCTDKKTLVIAAERMHLLDLKSGEDLAARFGESTGGWAMAFSPDGSEILAENPWPVDGPGQVVYWSPSTGKELRKASLKAGFVHLFSSDGTAALVTEYGNPSIVRWIDLKNDLAISLETRLPLETPSGIYAISNCGNFIALGDLENERIHLYDGPTRSRIRELKDDGMKATRLLFSRDEKRLFAFSADQTVRVWDTASGKKLSQYIPERAKNDRARTETIHPGELRPPHFEGEQPPYEFALSHDGKRIASTDLSEYVLIRDAIDGRNQIRIDIDKMRPNTLAFSGDDKFLVWASWDDPAIHILNIASGKEVGKLTGHIGLILSFVFSQDGKKLVSSSTDGTALVWDFERIEKSLH
jgi:RNA polymerase sigma factor (sigma-70 family)